VLENCRLAAQARTPRPWALWEPASRCVASNAAAREAAARAGLADSLERLAGLLSHGQKRQLEIAMCLAAAPQVLLLDEPLAGMGAEETDRMLQLLQELKPGSRHLAGGARHGRRLSRRRSHHGDDQRRRHRAAGRPRRCGTTGWSRPPIWVGIEMGSGTDPLLEARAIHAWYGSSHVLHGVDLSVARGETVGLLGRNGMGKSTLIRTLLGHVSQRPGPDPAVGAGRVARPAARMAHLGVAYVPEGRGVFPNLSVRENLLMAARKGRDGRCDWPLARVLETFPRLQERIGHLGAQLSGGEQQMLSIGRALMTHPDLIILDEATEGLAPLIVAAIWRVIAQMRAEGMATLIVDRDFRKVLAHSDRALVLQKGQVVLEGEALACCKTALDWRAVWESEDRARVTPFCALSVRARTPHVPSAAAGTW
jgi:branched-chain amino acid transport system ATP-binding protein